MACRYSEFSTGKCELYDGTIKMPGVNEDGVCICEDDPDPTYLCESYTEI